MAIETPRYKVLKKNGRIELRKYRGYILASVEIKANSYNSAANQAFSILADFIFGNNVTSSQISMTAPAISKRLETSEKIAMTAPVSASKLDNQTYLISFTMPAIYSIENLPKPNNKNVKIQYIPSHEIAVIRFSGYTTDSKIEKMATELKNWADVEKIKFSGDLIVSRYDPPWKPGFIRRNEISYTLDSSVN